MDKQIDMSKYVEAEEIHEKCDGCDHVFDFVPEQGTIVSRKCEVYEFPARKWETSGNIAKDKNGDPVVTLYCPMATHIEAQLPELDQKINPIKYSKRLMGKRSKKK